MDCQVKKAPTYARICCDFRPNQTEQHRRRITVGGDRLSCNGDTATPTASNTTMKMHLNSTISTPTAQYLTLDIKDFYLNSNLPEPEYIVIELHLIPPDFINSYNLKSIAKNGKILFKITKGMHGLKQEGKLACDDLKNHLLPYGYAPAKRSQGLWMHKLTNLTKTLIVDDFGIKHTNMNQAHHLINALKNKYEVAVNWGPAPYILVQL